MPSDWGDIWKPFGGGGIPLIAPYSLRNALYATLSSLPKKTQFYEPLPNCSSSLKNMMCLRTDVEALAYLQQ